MRYHPDQFFVFEPHTAGEIRAAIRRRSSARLIRVLDRCAADPNQVAAIVASLRIDDRLICLHSDAKREGERDAFLANLIGWAEAQADIAVKDAIEKITEQIRIIEAGYRLISNTIDQLPISKLPRERQLAALFHRAAADFDDLTKREFQFQKASDGSFSMASAVVVRLDEGGYSDIDSFTAGLADQLGNAIEYLAHGCWPATEGGIEVPLLPEPTNDEIRDADRLLILSLSWVCWQRWERQARYWNGRIRRFEGASIPEDNSWPGLETLYQHEREGGDYYDWVSVERSKQQHAQNNHAINRSLTDGEVGSSPQLPPLAFMDRAERLGADVVFRGAHLDPTDSTRYRGATLNEWLRGYAVLRRVANEAIETGSDAAARHLVRLDRTVLIERLCAVGVSDQGARSFIDGATYRAGSIDLFDTPLVRQGEHELLLIGPAAANTDGGRTLLSNLPNLGASLDHKGALFENEVVAFFNNIGLKCYNPARTILGETYQYDALVPWGKKLFLLECKNTAPSNLNPKIALDFHQRRVHDIRQVKRLVAGMRRHPELLTDDGGPDPTKLTIVPILLYAMPLARRGTEDGVYSADWSMIQRFFARADLGIESEFSTGEGSEPLVHRQVTK